VLLLDLVAGIERAGRVKVGRSASRRDEAGLKASLPDTHPENKEYRNLYLVNKKPHCLIEIQDALTIMAI
jgi:hypothetical protein